MNNSKNYEYKLIKYRYLSNKNPNNPSYTYKIKKYQNRLQKLQKSQQSYQLQQGGGFLDMFRKKEPTLEEIQEILKKAMEDFLNKYASKKDAYINKMSSMTNFLLKTTNSEEFKNLLNIVEKDKDSFNKINGILEELKNDNN